MDKGSAEEEKIDALLNSSVRGPLALQWAHEIVTRGALSTDSRGLNGIAVSQACGSLDKGLLRAYTAEVTPETWDDLGWSGDLG